MRVQPVPVDPRMRSASCGGTHGPGKTSGRLPVLPRGFSYFLRLNYNPPFFGSLSGLGSNDRGLGRQECQKRSEEGRRGSEGAPCRHSVRGGRPRPIGIPKAVKSISLFLRFFFQESGGAKSAGQGCLRRRPDGRRAELRQLRGVSGRRAVSTEDRCFLRPN